MRLKHLAFLSTLILLCYACQEDEQTPDTPQPRQATAMLYSLTEGSETPEQIGEALFVAENGIVRLTVTLAGLPAGGQHALHLHEGSCQNPGAHWNGGGSERYCDIPSQGVAWGRPFLGDIGNIAIDETGKGTLSLQTELWALGDGSPRDVVGTFLMLHAGPEDYSMACNPDHGGHQPTNEKIACGEIVLIED